MYLLILRFKTKLSLHLCNLHSNMYLLIPLALLVPDMNRLNLHSNMYLLIPVAFNHTYIPYITIRFCRMAAFTHENVNIKPIT